MPVPLSDDDWRLVKRKLHERLLIHQTRFAYVRLQLLIEEGLYQVSFTVDPETGLTIDWMNTPLVPRKKHDKFTEAELWRVLELTIDDLEEMCVDEEKECFIVAFELVAHDGFHQKIKRSDVNPANAPKVRATRHGYLFRKGLAKKP
jgi:hypothetical protein